MTASQGTSCCSRSSRTHRGGNDKGDHRLVAAPWHSQAAREDLLLYTKAGDQICAVGYYKE